MEQGPSRQMPGAQSHAVEWGLLRRRLSEKRAPRRRHIAFTMSSIPRGTPPSKCPSCGQVTKPGNMGKGFLSDPSHTPQQCIRFQAERIETLSAQLAQFKEELAKVRVLARLK